MAICGNVHGDEATGTLAIHMLDGRLPGLLETGTVVLYPSLNPEGLADGTRQLPDSHADLNRLFPGTAAGTPGQRHAARIWEDIRGRKGDVLVDLHADSARAIPYAIADRAVGRKVTDKARMTAELARLAQATGLLVLDEYPDDQYIRFHLDRSLAGAMVNHGDVPAITVEVGPRGWVDPEASETAVRAVIGVLQACNTAAGSPPPARTQPSWRRAASPRVRRAGLFVPELAPGDEFGRGERLARVVSVAGDVVDELRAPRAGVVISWLTVAWVEPGSVVGTLGLGEL